MKMIMMSLKEINKIDKTKKPVNHYDEDWNFIASYESCSEGDVK